MTNSSSEALERVQRLIGQRVDFHEVDLLDAHAVNAIFDHGAFDCAIYFAGLSAVGESVQMPLAYYQNNVVGSLNLLHSMEAAGVRRLNFSSSATVYGESENVPLSQESPLDATNPHGRTKEQVEGILSDLSVAGPRWRVALLRYLNPVGAHESGLIGEDPQGTPIDLLPSLLR